MAASWAPWWDAIFVVVVMAAFGVYVRRLTRAGGRGVRPTASGDITSSKER